MATKSAIKSLPISKGLSTLIDKPVFVPGPINKGSILESFFKADNKLTLICGTTEEKMMLSRVYLPLSITAKGFLKS